MAEQRVTRKLAAILVADVVGYARLMEADEAGTIARLRAIREELIDPKIAEHGGRVVKTTGDGMLAEFPSAVAAVRNAVEVQRALAERDAGVPEERRIVFRVGINLGDVVVEGDDILGQGVNVAARLEGLAEPGGLCISQKVYDEVAGKLDLAFEDLGERKVKNIERPLRVYRLRSGSETARAEQAAAGTTPEPHDKPAIAVLPFDNMSGDAEQEYFADGITEDIITELSRYRELLVIARNSSFAYKGKAADVKRVAAELGVDYVLEGGIRRAGNRVRITAQLIDAATGHHLWAERYDRDMDDIFALQDEITGIIVGALGAKLQASDIDRALRKEPASLDAYDLVLRATALFARINKSDMAEARRLCEGAIALDPGYARAHAWLAWTYMQDRFSGWADDPAEWLKRGYEAGRKAVTLDDTDYHAHIALGIFIAFMGRHDQGIAELERAVELNPNYADSHMQLGNALVFAGRADDAVAALETAMRLNPHHPPWYQMILGRALFVSRRYQDAVPHLERAVNAGPGLTQARAALAASYAALGRDQEASAEIDEIRATTPHFTLGYVNEVVSFKDAGDRDHLIDWLRQAGLPE